jgi:hypothetical protein
MSHGRTELRPLLLSRFPYATPEELIQARSDAYYGGAIIQDLGWHPFANQFLSGVVHHVRSGAGYIVSARVIHRRSHLREKRLAPEQGSRAEG